MAGQLALMLAIHVAAVDDYPPYGCLQLAEEATHIFVGRAAMHDIRPKFGISEIVKGVVWSGKREIVISIDLTNKHLEGALMEGKESTVFLIQDDIDGSFKAIGAFGGSLALPIRQFLQLDAESKSIQKCRRLVSIIADAHAPSAVRRYAIEDLARDFTKSEYLPVFERLAVKRETQRQLLFFLSKIEGAEATDRLFEMVHCSSDLRQQALRVLGEREPDNVELSRKLVPYLFHADESLRRNAAVAISDRSFREAAPEMADALFDEATMVRAVAARWPLHDWTPRVVDQLRILTTDDHEIVRASACTGLIHAQDFQSFYRLWRLALLDTRPVRRMPLGALVESNWLKSTALVAWPTLVVVGLGIVIRRLRRARIRSLIIGSFGAYVVGVIAGYWVGEFWCHAETATHSSLLTPAIVVPVIVAIGEVIVLTAAQVRNRSNDGLSQSI